MRLDRQHSLMRRATVMASREGYWERSRGGFSRRRAIGLAGGAGAAAFLIACGSSKSDQSSGTTKEATREAGVISGNQGSTAGETAKAGGAATFYWLLTPPLDPVVNTTYTTQRLASFTYPRLLKFKTDKEPKTSQNYETVP